jgi:hypothetical protein
MSLRQRFFSSVIKIWESIQHMEPEDLDIERITEDRRKAIEQNIYVISIEDLKSLGEKLFPFLNTHGGSCFSSSSRRTAAAHFTTPRQMIDLKSFTAPQRRKACGSRGVEPWVHCRRGELRP